MKFQDALFSDKIFNFIDIPANAYTNNTNFSGKFVPQYVSSIGDYAFYLNNFNTPLYFPYCKNIGDYAFSRREYDSIINLRFGDVDTIGKFAFYLDGYNKTWGNYRLSFGNVGTIESNAFNTAYLNTKVDVTFCNVGIIKSHAFAANMFTTDVDKGFRFKNVDRIESGAFNGFNGSFHGVASFENVRVIENGAFNGQNFSVLKLPDKFRTRAELVRIGVGNPDMFKID
ncbi:TPA: leucine-rich repeat protein [Campylobacter fetus subsp. venerealis]|uniref:Leucine-rich repeat domain-containing protein n=3 Tax=Campylobacter fetus TaxID=196 RepID=A0AAE6IZM5_CAMFE|nr:leucine-rich repeat protein [Campylobacter fetus]OCS30504.1 hypothetical protein CFVLMG6570_08825 [Campylobacter fetus subsp. venerealis LMG 6570 = CCUG 33900]HAC4631597.1 leucine-rich repeat protein [Listeria monocytogenes]EAK0415577.1 hypothetical protein [Campylobacter fetus]EAK0835615.1 hypothetical protein [Campylobacter fetus]EAK5853253.1 hypothetical protein [Campylobacter fetus]